MAKNHKKYKKRPIHKKPPSTARISQLTNDVKILTNENQEVIVGVMKEDQFYIGEGEVSTSVTPKLNTKYYDKLSGIIYQWDGNIFTSENKNQRRVFPFIATNHSTGDYEAGLVFRNSREVAIKQLHEEYESDDWTVELFDIDPNIDDCVIITRSNLNKNKQ